MDAAYGPAASALTQLSRSIRTYSLFQGIQQVLDRLRLAHPGLDDDALHELLDYQANPSLGFPGSDIDQLEFFEHEGALRARLRINLVGLFGAGSPIPAFYGDQALGDLASNQTTRDFLDLFNNRLQRMLLPIWSKYRYYARFRAGATDTFSEHLFALIGMGGASIRASAELNWNRLLPYLGLLSLRAHSAALIEAVLRYYFKHEQLNIEQCVERQVQIDTGQLNSLGRAQSRLGLDTVLGAQVHDRSGKFRIHIKALDWERFHEFLPIGPGYRPLCALVRFTLRDPLDYDIRLQLKPDALRELRIGQNNPCRLGWTSWLGTARADGIVTLSSQTTTDGTP
ncbi:type VI secretion system baseplate subunit TssG [Pseudomonas sp. Marseille-QA0892]